MFSFVDHQHTWAWGDCGGRVLPQLRLFTPGTGWGTNLDPDFWKKRDIENAVFHSKLAISAYIIDVFLRFWPFTIKNTFKKFQFLMYFKRISIFCCFLILTTSICFILKHNCFFHQKTPQYLAQAHVWSSMASSADQSTVSSKSMPNNV